LEETRVKAFQTGWAHVCLEADPPADTVGLDRNLTDEDLRAVYAYVGTIPAVHNRVP
jgi:hypothetical protein